MIFASDLDGTIIFSKKFISENDNKSSIKVIEKIRDEEISYMTKKSIGLLRGIHKTSTFIPVTTRTLEQYNRISIFKKEIIPAIAVTSNGGKVLFNGVSDMEWETYIRSGFDNIKIYADCVLKKLLNIMDNRLIEGYRHSDELFFTVILKEESFCIDDISEFILWARQSGWRVSYQGRKLYIIPEFINKRDAIFYIKNKLGVDKIISAGDSLLDLSLLEASDFSIAPSHGELRRQFEAGMLEGVNIEFTKAVGILSCEEVLNRVHEKLRKNCHGLGLF